MLGGDMQASAVIVLIGLWWCVQVLPVCGTQAAAAAASLEGAEAPIPVGEADGPALPPGGAGSNTSAATAAEQPCRPDQLMDLNVTSHTAYLSLHPGLRYPNIQVPLGAEQPFRLDMS